MKLLNAMYVALMFIPSVFAHSDHVEQVDPGISIYAVLLLAFFASIPPMFVGILPHKFKFQSEFWQEKQFIKPLSLSLGVIIFLFYDYLSLSSFIGLQSSSYTRISLLLTFILTIYLFVLTEPVLESKFGILGTAYLWAIGLGIHSFSEGIIMGYNFTLGLVITLQILPILSFFLHKIAEAFTLSVLIKEEVSWKTYTILILLSAILVILGVALGFLGGTAKIPNFAGRLTLYLYTISAAATTYILPKFFLKEEDGKTYALWATAGFIFMYFGTLLHEL